MTYVSFQKVLPQHQIKAPLAISYSDEGLYLILNSIL